MDPLVKGATVVAAVQYAPVVNDVRKNMATAQQMTFEAAKRGARVIVLPELAFSGINFLNAHEAFSQAQSWDGPQTQSLVPIAKKFNCYVVAGYVQAEANSLFNSAVVVGPKGPLTNFQKHNLWGPDNLWAQASDQLPFNVINIPEVGRMGVLICRDIKNNFRESYPFYNSNSRFYRFGSIDTIALVTSWGMQYAYPDSSWVELSESLRANIIVSNRIGTDKDLTFKGGSCVIDRTKRVWTNGSSFDKPAIVGGIVLSS